jgi:choline dehydrogenase-like flavoprotein
VAQRPDGIVFGGELSGAQEETCDVCVVGSGPGGAVAADEIVKAGRRVIMIEEGPLPEAGASLAPHEAMKYYRDQALFTTHGPMHLPIFSGCVFGGTSVINSGTCFHTPERIFDWWAKDFGVEFRRTAWRKAEREHDTDLSIRLCPMDRMSFDNRLFAEGLDRLGMFGGSPLMRAEKGCVGSARCCFICPKDAKQAVNLNLLKRSLEQGMRAFVETRAEKLELDGQRVTGIVCSTAAGGRVTIRASAFVLAMGALYTPDFLLKNGFRRQYPALGRNLSIHPASKVFAEMPYSVRPWEGVPQSYRYDDPDNPDVHFEGASLPPSPGATTVPLFGPDLAEWMQMYDRVAGFGFFLSDTEYGRLYHVPGVGPVVRYRLTPRDVENFCFAVKLIARVWFGIGARRVLLPVSNRRQVYESYEDVERALPPGELRSGDVYASAFHPLGTCRFSKTIETGVVESTGRCHRHENLYICDGAAIPGPLHVNPQVTIMAFSRLAARGLVSKLG